MSFFVVTQGSKVGTMASELREMRQKQENVSTVNRCDLRERGKGRGEREKGREGRRRREGKRARVWG